MKSILTGSHAKILEDELVRRMPEATQWQRDRLVQLYNEGHASIKLACSTDEGWDRLIEAIRKN
jgi:hypothetical protein